LSRDQRSEEMARMDNQPLTESGDMEGSLQKGEVEKR
jgi:hypothetical protein